MMRHPWLDTDAALAGGESANAFRRELLHGLRQRPRCISPKYFYDAQGSRLFERICELPEYYPTRVEETILREHAHEIAREVGRSRRIVEFGAGSLRKIRLLLDALNAPSAYLPMDISGEHLEAAVRGLRANYPDLVVQPLVADYTQPLMLHSLLGEAPLVGVFLGSTLGNFSPDEALAFLQSAARLLRGGGLLLGVDLVKAPELLHAAYNDAQGVTAAFNINLLCRANSELGADFDLKGFVHAAFYNAPLHRVEMHLMSRHSQTVHLAGETLAFEEGETIHTENSYKYTIAGLRDLARTAGFDSGPVWTDSQHLFSVHWLPAPIMDGA